MDLERKFERYVPPGANVRQELKWFAWGGAVSLLYSFGFLIRYLNDYSSLFLWDGSLRVLDISATMPDFIEVLGSSLIGFLILELCMSAVIIYHYAYHYQGSKSIYLMKRLPSRFELHRRCVTLPVLAVTASLCAALMLLLIYFAIYMAFTPKACLTPHQWQKIWSVLLGVAI
ncbi:hypothetical protein OXPF_08570 [Oxobacter pfennigii]|uniref:Uncharacterized protein n=1 Tax=Oxobacter pfennigii TaxID=36849 RepID=A0A0N8NTS2_9CLOT|nr:hypothetical protein [Oxobacter pfennigii]KPU45624.1 hypothetical protein OXPF_08570 [Oxobacter pfennigii]